MKKKDKKLFSKIVVIIFLILLVLGFTIPGFFYYRADNNADTQYQVEPRLCQTDADCYLICDEQATPVLCSQNLCHQNSCDQYSYYEYVEDPITFNLEVVTINQENIIEKIDLSQRAHSQDIFVQFENDVVRMHSSRLTLDLVLEKANLRLDANCLHIAAVSYCEGEANFLSLVINGEQMPTDTRYVPQEDDQIQISYLPREPLN